MNCWSKLELMCMSLEEVLNLGFLGHSCFSELLTLTSVVRYLKCITRGEMLSLSTAALCWRLLGHRTKDISQKTQKSTIRADFKAVFLSMTAASLVLFQEKLLRLPEQWTSLEPCTTFDSLPLPSFIMSQSALKCQPWVVCTTPRGHLWELV